MPSVKTTCIYFTDKNQYWIFFSMAFDLFANFSMFGTFYDQPVHPLSFISPIYFVFLSYYIISYTGISESLE